MLQLYVRVPLDHAEPDDMSSIHKRSLTMKYPLLASAVATGILTTAVPTLASAADGFVEGFANYTFILL